MIVSAQNNRVPLSMSMDNLVDFDTEVFDTHYTLA